MINTIKRWFGRNNIRNRKVNRARFLFLYVIFGAIAGLLYFVAALFLDWPKQWALTPLYLLVAFIFYVIGKNNAKDFWLYVSNSDQGRLRLFLNEHTHFSEKHKKMLVKWVYLDNRSIRRETYLEITNKLMDGQELTKDEKRWIKKKVVGCPQQVKDGFNEAILVNALIYAHNNIHVLDDEIRKIMNLTIENMINFDLNKEYEKCKDAKYRKLMEVGQKASERLNKKQ